MKYRMPPAAVPIVTEQPSQARSRSLLVTPEKNRRIVPVGSFIDRQIHVQVPIVIIIEKTGHGRLHMNIQPVFGCHVLKMRNAFFIDTLVDIQYVPPPQRICIDGITDIDIHKPVVVYIDYGHAPGPSARSVHARLIRYVLEMKPTLIKIQPAGHPVAGKVNIGQSIIIEISDADPSSIINIHDIEWVNRIVFYNAVIEKDP